MEAPRIEMAHLTGANGDFDEELEVHPLIKGSSSASEADRRRSPRSPKGGALGGADTGGRARPRRAKPWGTAEWAAYLRVSLYELFFGSHLNILLVFVPVAIASVHIFHLPEAWVFTFALLAMMPLAERLGFTTEQLAHYTGPTLGGLLNATFGNATELIISVFALRNNLIRVVQMSLLGSILSNMLLVLGCSFLAGGLKFREQKFNKTAAMVNSGLLLMAVMGLMFPAVLQATHTELNGQNSELQLSRFSSGIMLLAYCCYLYFQLKTHTHLYDEGPEGEDGDDEEEAVLGMWGSILWMGAITLLIAVLSEYLVDAIQGAAVGWGLPVSFISVIVLPIVGNASEHASAIMFAAKDKVDISLGIAIGSSTQISMFAIPFCVVCGWAMGVPMDLDFHIFETATLFITVLVVAALLQEGECNYFKGIMLVLSYLIVAASFYVHDDHEIVMDQAGLAAAPRAGGVFASPPAFPPLRHPKVPAHGRR